MKIDLVKLLQAAGERTRLRLLNLIAANDVCVCYFVEVLGEPQPKISRHLAYLRRAGLVRARREGKWMHYSLVRPADDRVARVLDAVLAAAATDRQLQRDRMAFDRTCCATRLPAPLQNAPRPVPIAALAE
ncbi:MAG TPA: metalloregulator ArsR/SmtB family transcription factor [Thermoanaerobaculia bacterium]|nr:metalloregulator ArsR/SmtB family transcription factor [Thermoanaerobaculia bacterium]